MICSILALACQTTNSPALAFKHPTAILAAGKWLKGLANCVIPGDQALDGSHVDFIKIDVEGMEMKALGGLSQTIARCRPRIFIELDRVNKEDFGKWVKFSHYEIRARFKRYRVNENFLLVPRPVPGAEAAPETAGKEVQE